MIPTFKFSGNSNKVEVADCVIIEMSGILEGVHQSKSAVDHAIFK